MYDREKLIFYGVLLMLTGPEALFLTSVYYLLSLGVGYHVARVTGIYKEPVGLDLYLGCAFVGFIACAIVLGVIVVGMMVGDCGQRKKD